MDSVGYVCVFVCFIVLYICICIKNNYRICHEFEREWESLGIVRSRGRQNDVNRVLWHIIILKMNLKIILLYLIFLTVYKQVLL